MCLFIHAKGTTGKHAKERRRKPYGTKCSQCGQRVGGTTVVAAHLNVYICGCVPAGTILRTSCKKCNHHKAKRTKFWGIKLRLRKLK